MSLRYVVSASPKHVVVERSSLQRPGEDNYWMQLEQVTVNAVANALQYQVGSQRLLNNLPANDSKIATRRTQRLRDWSLDKDSEDRRHVAAKIYALLVQWKSDFSFEWRAKVAAAVHVFEEAMYQQAKSKDEYTNPLLLELQLTRVLRHFEVGNGGCLLGVKTPLNPLQEFPCPRSVCHLVMPEQLEDTRMSSENESKEREALDLNGTQESADSLLALQMRFSTKEVANNELWEAILKGQKSALEKNHQKLKEQASIKRRVERVVNLISKGKRRDQKRLKHELQKAMADHNPERLANMLASAKLAYSKELKDLCNAAEVMLVKLLEAAGAADTSSGDDDRPRRRTGKSLRDRLKSECEISDGIKEYTFPPNSKNFECSELSERMSLSCGNDNEVIIHVSCTEFERQNLNSDMHEHPAMPVGRKSEMQNQFVSSSLSSGIEDLVVAENVVQRSDSIEASAELHAEGDGETKDEIISEQIRDRHRDVCSQSIVYSEISVVADLQNDASSAQTNGQDAGLSLQVLEQTLEVSPLIREIAEEQITQTANDQDEALSIQVLEQTLEVSPEIRRIAEGQISQRVDEAGDYGASPASEGQISQRVDEAGESGASPASEAREVSNRVSLMRLLAEGDEANSVLVNQYTSGTCPLASYSLAPSETWEEPTEQLDPVCCVCMVGRKGAALVPCGHTFCRRCSRELWRGRGTCPLCNRFIREILDIY